MKLILPLVLLAGLSVRAQASDPICLAAPGNAVSQLMQQMRQLEEQEAAESDRAKQSRKGSWWREEPLPEEVPASAQVSLLSQACGSNGYCTRAYLVRLTWSRAGGGANALARIRSVAATIETCGTIQSNGQGDLVDGNKFKVVWR